MDRDGSAADYASRDPGLLRIAARPTYVDLDTDTEIALFRIGESKSSTALVAQVENGVVTHLSIARPAI